jgi:hypothetical protein
MRRVSNVSITAYDATIASSQREKHSAAGILFHAEFGIWWDRSGWAKKFYPTENSDLLTPPANWQLFHR